MKRTNGFTLVELVIVMAVIALILSVVIPNLRGMQQEGENTKVEAELNTLKTAVVSFWRNNGNVYPPDLAALLNASPKIINSELKDPFQTSSNTYGYISANDTTFGDYFVIYSRGPNADTTSSAISFTNGVVHWSGSGRIVSNAPTAKP